MLLVLEVLYYFVLLRADVGLRQDLVVVGVEVELMLEGHAASVFPDILVHELLARESVLDSCYQFSGGFVTHEGASLGDGLDEYVVVKFVSGGWDGEVVTHYYNLTNTGIEDNNLIHYLMQIY